MHAGNIGWVVVGVFLVVFFLWGGGEGFYRQGKGGRERERESKSNLGPPGELPERRKKMSKELPGQKKTGCEKKESLTS